MADDLLLQRALSKARDTKALLIARGAIRQAPAVLRAQFEPRPVLVVADAHEFEAAGREVIDTMKQADVACEEPLVFDEPDLYAEHRHVTPIEQRLASTGATPIAVGAGTINDLVKLAAHRTGRPYMAVATAASMDGYTAFGASITHQGSKQTFDCPAPRAVVADLDVIASAPPSLNAAGYADLLAKITAGADWIIAEELNREPVDATAWEMVQGRLRHWLSQPEEIRRGNGQSLGRLIEGLMMSGFAMQWTRTSRPASGAEHQFSHLWDMQHHTHNGSTPSHGFKVGVATLAVAQLMERLIELPLESLDIDAALSRWPEPTDEQEHIRRMFDTDHLIALALQESAAKRLTRDQLRAHLELLRARWPQLKRRLRAQIGTTEELKQMLSAAGAAVEPEQIGITPDRLRRSFRQAFHIRRRYTVLDLAVRAGVLEEALR